MQETLVHAHMSNTDGMEATGDTGFLTTHSALEVLVAWLYM